MTVVDEGEQREQRRNAAARLGRTLRAVRERNGLSQEEVAHAAGLAVYTYSTLERGCGPLGNYPNPTLDTILRVVTALDLELPAIEPSEPLSCDE